MEDKDLNPNDFPDYPVSVLDGSSKQDFDGYEPMANSNEFSGIGFFSIFEIFEKENLLYKEDKKLLRNFKRDLYLESLLMDKDLDISVLTKEQQNKMTEYFKIISAITPKLNRISPNHLKNMVNKYTNNNGKSKPFKKARWKDVKRKQV